MAKTATKTKPAPVIAPKPPTKEAVRQMVLADQAAALKDAANRPPATATGTAQPETTAKPTKKAEEKKADTRKITVLATTNPHVAGSRREGFFKQLKAGMTVDEAIAAGVRSGYLKRMAVKKIIKLG